MALVQLSSRINRVKVYAAGATITRVAPLTAIDLAADIATTEIELAGLPLALEDSSVRVQIAPDASRTIVTDVRVGLSVPPHPQSSDASLDAAIRAARAEVQQLHDLLALIQREIRVLQELQVPDRPQSEPGKAPPPSPLSARLALAQFKQEQIQRRVQEQRQMQETLRKAQEHLDSLLEQQRLASTAQAVQPHELRKTVIVRLGEREAGAESGEALSLVVEYFVPGARWTPTYQCRLESAANQASIAVRALICQKTGEDWSGVQLELSTAEPLSWCELPELPSLRLGRLQPAPIKPGWRTPPAGADALFEDFDRQKPTIATSGLQQAIFPVTVAPLPTLAAPTIDAAPGAAVPPDECDLMLIDPAMLSQTDEFYDASEFEQVTQLSAPAAAPSPRMMTRSMAKRAVPAAAPLAASPLPEPPRFSIESTAQVEWAEQWSYGLLRLGDADDQAQRGKLKVTPQAQRYLETLTRQQVQVAFGVVEVIQQAIAQANSCLSTPLPSRGVSVRSGAGSFDYAYQADGRVEVPSDGQFHSVALTSHSTDVDVRYVVVPREDANVFRIAQLLNPLPAPLLEGPVDVYVNDEYVLSTTIPTVPPYGQMELGLGVEPAIKVARNTQFQESRSGKILVAFNELCHHIQIEIANRLLQPARIEVRERLPVPQEGAKVDVEVDRAEPAWEPYEQQERGAPIRGGHRWQIMVPAGETTRLSAQYTIKTYVDSELVGGNRREG